MHELNLGSRVFAPLEGKDAFVQLVQRLWSRPERYKTCRHHPIGRYHHDYELELTESSGTFLHLVTSSSWESSKLTA